MGEIFLARLHGAAGFEKLVVLKRILPHLARSERERYQSMLLDEARIAARLTHPNVCHVYELDQVDDELFICMEYLEGVTGYELLKRLRRQERLLDPRVVVSIALQACEGLHAAHELTDAKGYPSNLVHRDVSLSNIFLTADGVIKILDFGIAKVPGQENKTDTGIVKGKWAYMSPEQILRRPLDRRSDLFSLGVVIFELMANRRLYHRRSEFETCRMITEEDAPSLRQWRPEVPQSLEEVVGKTLARNRDARYPSARALAEALTAAAADIGGSASMGEISGLISTTFATELAQRRRFVEGVCRNNLGDKPGSRAATNDAAPKTEVLPQAPTMLGSAHAVGPAAPDPSGPNDPNDPNADQSARDNADWPSDSDPDIPATNLHVQRSKRAGSRPDSQGSRHGERQQEPQWRGQPHARDTPRVYTETEISPPRSASTGARLLFIGGLAAGLLLAVIAAAGVLFWKQNRDTPTHVVTLAGDALTDALGDAPTDRPSTVRLALERGSLAPETQENAASASNAPPSADAAPPATASTTGSRDKTVPAKRARRQSANDPSRVFRRALVRRNRQMRACYEQHLDPVQQGEQGGKLPRLEVVMIINTKGRVTEASLQPARYGESALGDCLLAIVRDLDFGAQKDAVQVTIPLGIRLSKG